MSTGRPRIVGAISLAHTINDFYMNYIQTLLPFLIAAGLGMSRGAFLVTAFTVTSSLSQPVFGYLVDRRSKAWLVYLGTLWMGSLLPLIGFVQSYPVLLMLVILAGLGTAAFHPQASSIMGAISKKSRGAYQAFFIAMGNMGWALTPLIVVPFITRFGIDRSYIFFFPGWLAAFLLWMNVPKAQGGGSRAGETADSLKALVLRAGPELSKVLAVVSLRSVTQLSLVALLPFYLVHMQVPLLTSSRLVSLMLVFGALGGVFGGYLSDVLGRKPMVIGSLFLSTPLLFCAVNTRGGVQAFFLAVAGACLIGSFSVTVVIAQEIMTFGSAFASGLMLGFGVGLGGLGVSIMALIAEYWGIDFAMKILISIPLLAGLIALSFKTRQTSAPIFNVNENTFDV